MKQLFKTALNRIPRKYLIRSSLAVRPLLAIYLKGDKYTDPIDGKSFREFLPYGYENIRENALSPSTLSLERHRLLWLYLKNETDFFTANKKVLHFAPEQAFFERFKAMENLDYTTTDIESPIADVKADICNLPFPNDSFDLIICNHVLEHIEDDRRAMNELYRVMKLGGMGILQVPYEVERETTYEDPSITTKKDRKEAFGQYDHVRVYGKDFFKRLENTGFKVVQADYTKKLTDEQIERYCLNKGEIIPVVYK